MKLNITREGGSWGMGHGSWGKTMLRLLHAHLLRAYLKSKFCEI
jgi:hypothetical protein